MDKQAYVVIQLDDTGDGSVNINIDFKPELSENIAERELTPAQAAGLACAHFLMTEVFASVDDGSAPADVN
jgi:hypothetical protein